jgi:predicted transcriptional regulator
VRRPINAEKMNQVRAASLLGVSQPTVHEALKKGRLKSLSLEDISEYRSRIKSKDNYWTKKTEIEQARHEEMIEAIKGLNRRLEVLTGVLIAMAGKEVLK